MAFAVPDVEAQIVVAKDGSGQFSSVQQAVDAAPSHSRTRVVIHIKPGVYQERVTVPSEKTFVTLEGEDARTTMITAGVHAGMPGANGKPLITFGTPTVFIQANDFRAENLTFENSAGAQGQALALTIMSDRGVFRNCRFLGYQDTLLAQAGRQLFEHCYIEGAVDFIFGGSTAWFEDCEIHVKANGYISAPNTPRDQHYGYIFSHCRITGEPNVQTFLGRPWRPYGYTVYMNTEMSDAIRPGRWDNWNSPARERTARFGEYHNTGPGAEFKPSPTLQSTPTEAKSGERSAVPLTVTTEGRPAATVGSWAHRLTDAEARELTIENVLAGLDGWNPKTGTVRFVISVAKDTAASRAVMARDTVWLATTVNAKDSGSPALAYSADGNKWTTLSLPLPEPTLGQKQMLDPRLIEVPDGTFHMVWATAARGDKGIGHATSKDLAHWSEPVFIPLAPKPEALDLVSPNLFYDEVSRRYVITWACTMAKNLIQSFQEEVEDNPRLWYVTTRDFAAYSEPELLFDPNYSVRDGIILEDRGRYLLVHNDNTWPMLNLRSSVSSTPFGPWGMSSDAFTAKFTGFPVPIQSGHEVWVYYTNTQSGIVGLLKTRDFRTFQDATAQLSFPEGRRPVSVLPVVRSVLGLK